MNWLIHLVPYSTIPDEVNCKELFDFIKSRDQQIALEAQTVNRFEIINHLSDGTGREVVVWRGESFKVEFSMQDGGRTLKAFLTDVATLKHQSNSLGEKGWT